MAKETQVAVFTVEPGHEPYMVQQVIARLQADKTLKGAKIEPRGPYSIAIFGNVTINALQIFEKKLSQRGQHGFSSSYYFSGDASNGLDGRILDQSERFRKENITLSAANKSLEEKLAQQNLDLESLVKQDDARLQEIKRLTKNIEELSSERKDDYKPESLYEASVVYLATFAAKLKVPDKNPLAASLDGLKALGFDMDGKTPEEILEVVERYRKPDADLLLDKIFRQNNAKLNDEYEEAKKKKEKIERSMENMKGLNLDQTTLSSLEREVSLTIQKIDEAETKKKEFKQGTKSALHTIELSLQGLESIPLYVLVREQPHEYTVGVYLPLTEGDNDPVINGILSSKNIFDNVEKRIRTAVSDVKIEPHLEVKYYEVVLPKQKFTIEELDAAVSAIKQGIRDMHYHTINNLGMGVDYIVDEKPRVKFAVADIPSKNTSRNFRISDEKQIKLDKIIAAVNKIGGNARRGEIREAGGISEEEIDDLTLTRFLGELAVMKKLSRSGIGAGTSYGPVKV